MTRSNDHDRPRNEDRSTPDNWIRMVRNAAGKARRFPAALYRKLFRQKQGKDYRHPGIKLEHIGTRYGGWTVPAGYFKPGMICYLAGAGEDISFDVELARRFGVTACIIDPTPRAEAHFKSLCEAVRNGADFPVNNNPDRFYKADEATISRLQFVSRGLWKEDREMRFYKPKDESHVSHSLVNLQKTEEYVTVPVVRLETLMAELGHDRVDFLKLDIEGAEYAVLDDLLESALRIGVLCIEFDEMNNPVDDRYRERIEGYLDRLKRTGYRILYQDAVLNTTLALEPVCRELESEDGS